MLKGLSEKMLLAKNLEGFGRKTARDEFCSQSHAQPILKSLATGFS